MGGGARALLGFAQCLGRRPCLGHDVYYGYLAATAGIRVIDVGKISENIDKVMKQCEAQSSLTVPGAFRKALASRK